MILERQQMKDNLIAILAQEYKVQNDMTPIDFLETFCHYIGDPNSILRGDLMDPVFKTFGVNDETFSDEESAGIIDRLTGPENLTYSVGSNGPCIAFKRSYSALVVACLLWRQQQRPFLSERQLSRINERLTPGFMTQQLA